MIPWLHLMTPLIGAKITAYMPSVALYKKSLYSVWKETIGIEIVTQKGIASVHDY